MPGLTLLTIGGVLFIDMGLQAFVFTKAEQDIKANMLRPPDLFIRPETAQKLETNSDLTQEEKAQVRQWLQDYNNWKENYSNTDPVTSQRHRSASTNLSLIIVGLLLYLYHWRTIKRETNNT